VQSQLAYCSIRTKHVVILVKHSSIQRVTQILSTITLKPAAPVVNLILLQVIRHAFCSMRGRGKDLVLFVVVQIPTPIFQTGSLASPIQYPLCNGLCMTAWCPVITTDNIEPSHYAPLLMSLFSLGLWCCPASSSGPELHIVLHLYLSHTSFTYRECLAGEKGEIDV